MIHWYHPPIWFPADGATVWVCRQAMGSPPFKAVWDEAAAEFTSIASTGTPPPGCVAGVGVVPWWDVNRWRVI